MPDSNPSSGTNPRSTDLHSRSRLAGYDPQRLFAARAVVVGAGALGQNLLLDLALAGIGQIAVVDFDAFEPHNATRSPLYPSRQEQGEWGLSKARVVAHKLMARMTAPCPAVSYANAPIEALGDAPIAWADLIFSAVDTRSARAYLAERCRLHGKPLFEAGFTGPSINLAVFGPDADEPCWRCTNPDMEGAFSCTRYALAAEAAGIIPAIQNTAAVLAGLQAESGIMWLHGEAPLRGRIAYGDIRALTLRTATLTRDEECAGIHRLARPAGVLPLLSDAPLETLLHAVRDAVGPAEVRFPSQFLLRISCTTCGAMAEPRCPEWRWLLAPRCSVCGGPFPRVNQERAPSAYASLSTERLDALVEVLEMSCAMVGLPLATDIEVWPLEGKDVLLLRLGGRLDELLTMIARSVPVPCVATKLEEVSA